MKTFFYFFVIFTPFLLFAGEKGNGGYAVVCRDQNESILSAELLDIYEGRIIYKKTFSYGEHSREEIVNSGISKLTDPLFINFLKKEISLIERNSIFIPVGNELEATEDAFPAIKKSGCRFEQLANYQKSGEILISEEIYNHLNELNKAALTLHEAIYSIRRKSVGDKTSESARKMTSQLLAMNTDFEMIGKWISDTFYRPNNTTPCGLTGYLYERIENCLYTKKDFSKMFLVTRTQDGQEVWFDQIKGLLWSDRFQDYVNYDEAITSCASIHSEMGHLYDYEWRLPTIVEFSARASEYITTLPNMNRFGDPYWFWTSSSKGKSVIIFNGADGQKSSNPFKALRNGSVRCVAKVNP